MTTRSALTAFFASLFTVALPFTTAEAQCDPQSGVCVEAHVGGSVQVGGAAPVVVAPPPPPPPPSPPPTIIYIHPAPPPAPPPVPAAPPPPPPRARIREPRIGLSGRVGGVGGKHVQMGGIDVALRFRPKPGLGIDFGIGGYGGTDHNGLDRGELPVTVDFRGYVNPRSPLQFYLLGGVGLSFAHAEGENRFTGVMESRDFAYAGLQGGIGLEWRIGRHFALHGDIRLFVRGRIDEKRDVEPEFVEYENGVPTGRSSNASGGSLGTLGATFYF